MRLIERVKSDVTFLKGAVRVLKLTTPIAKNPTRVFPHVVADLAERHGDAPALLSDRESFSYRELAARAARYARWALAQGLRKGDAVCLMMPSRPEYMAVWLGVTQAGGIVALVNTHLADRALAHCIDIVAPKHVIVAAACADAFATARSHLTGDPTLWLHGPAGLDAQRVDEAVDRLPGHRLTATERVPLGIEDKALYIYTSGTTGLPKAANINHYRLMLASHGFAGAMATRTDDRIYDCLPMFHTTGGVVTPGAALVAGGSVVIREKFSASEFWDDVVRWDCTMFQYIGELCRYLLNTPEADGETRHRVRQCCGNGLRPDIWRAFQERFRIPRVLEFYAATEGNVSAFNFDGRLGAVGRQPWFLAHRFPTAIVRYDVGREEPVRGADGFCVRCAVDEPGEVIGKILNDAKRPGNRFEGYADAAATSKKILRDVFEQGDAWFRTGDLMRRDADDYFYFVDRIGDTFRWKGENVATSEVSEAIGVYPGVLEANVYGVAVAGREGRAGMAALRVDDAFDLKCLHDHLVARLPTYARPPFVRIRSEIDVTATFKQKKVDLVHDGFDPAGTTDEIYFDDPRRGTFVRLDARLYDEIQNGEIRL